MASIDNPGIQSGIHEHQSDSSEFMKYSLFLGGTNAKADVIRHLSPLVTGHSRLFMVKKPEFVKAGIPNKMAKFKHILEYAFTEISGLSDITLNTEQITGGYTGKALDVPTMTSDGTTEFTVTTYEFSGSPVREVIDYWVNGIHDKNTNLTHYNGVARIPGINEGEGTLDVNQANEVAEFVYCMTDATGMNVEYACLLCNCLPKTINLDPYTYSSGQHNLVQTAINFSCTKYESIQINVLAAELVRKNAILSNSLNFHSGYSISGNNAFNNYEFKHIDVNDGIIKENAATAAEARELIVPQAAGTWK